ncbi:hypothetical protein QBC43DRAFT_370186 [Cladorrhinum sp. PSN259]|nr:hypothetical protein QBC43DRAFT_370186 [Cladorrhinum sp. PSN259]
MAAMDGHPRKKDPSHPGQKVVDEPPGPEIAGHWHDWMRYLMPPTTEQELREAQALGNFNPSSSRGGRRVPSAYFYDWIKAYCAIAPGCPPLFRQLVEHILALAPPDQLNTAVLGGLLINKDLIRYGLDATFWDALERYQLFDGYWDTQVPVSMGQVMFEIPEEYLPQSFAAPSVRHPTAGEEQIREEEADEEIDRGDVDTIENLVRAIRQDVPLDQIEPVVRINGIPVQTVLPRDILSGLTQGGRDWTRSSWYGLVPQPPLAQRLYTIINFLADEDRDRTPGWEAQRSEIVRYLHWLATIDERNQLRKASLQTRQMFECAVDMAIVHAVYEQHYHGDSSAVSLNKPDVVPLKSTRLSYLLNPYDWQLPSRRGVPNKRDLVERPITGRPPETVNVDFTEAGVRSGDHLRHIEYSKQFWRPVSGRITATTPIPVDVIDQPGRLNWAHREHRSYEWHSRPGNIGWELSPNLVLPQFTPAGLSRAAYRQQVRYSTERGARRAGLQKMLRYFNTGVHDFIYSPWRQLVLMDESAAVNAAKQADGIQWVPPCLTDDELPDWRELETHPYDVTWGDFFFKLRSFRSLCEREVTRERGNTLAWVTLPRNTANGGPFVWRKIDPILQDHQDRLKACLVMENVLRAAYKKWPRKLLRRAIKAMGNAKNASHMDHSVPEGITLAFDEQVETPRPIPVGRFTTTPRQITYDDLVWLRRLAQPGVSDGTWERRYYPESDDGKYTLYQIFAKRVQKALDDPNPNGLFADTMVRVSVERLLKVINPGGGPDVKRARFGPYDACSYLDRLAAQGHIKFRLDPTCYGVIERPNAQYFPEHRVVWREKRPEGANPQARPNWKAEHYRSWSEIMSNKSLIADVKKGSPVYNFFLALGYRLGYTICQLRHLIGVEETSPAGRPVVPTQRLLDAYGAYDRKVRETHERLDESQLFHWHDPRAIIEELEEDANFLVYMRRPLERIRSQIIDEISENKNMIAPAREIKLPNNGGSKFVHEISWDWALYPRHHKPEPRQWWKLDRWPVEPGWFLEEATLRAITTDADTDLKWTFDATCPNNDPVDQMYKRRNLEPYVDKPTKFRSGPAVYPAGDTRYQRKKVEEHMTEMVHKATKVPPPKRPGFINRLFRKAGTAVSGLGLTAEPIETDGRLPVIKIDVPRSWDPNRDIHKEFHPYLKRRKLREEEAEGPKKDTRYEERDICGRKRRKLDAGDFREVGQWYGGG